VNGPFVADASVAIAWVHPAQATAETQAMLQSVRAGALLHVPALWPLEVANALLVLTRRRKLSAAERRVALGWLEGLSFPIWPVSTDCRSTTPSIWNSPNDGVCLWPARTDRYVRRPQSVAWLPGACLSIIAKHSELRAWYRRLGFRDGETKTFPHLPFEVLFMDADIPEVANR
jgi:hypothetical protein